MSKKGKADTEVESIDLRSKDIADDKRQELLRLFPEVRTEGDKIDFERLKAAIGEIIDVGKERYGLTWPGKADCFKAIQTPSIGTLRPVPEESINFDATENLIIEGDNLEVLKLLQKSYLGKVKMIYIDPPYNTGNDFIYPDDFSESLKTYLQYTGQVDAEGKKFNTNTDTHGRFHSKWLNMMYPRLYLARNLLRKDGVLLISVNDVEVAKLRNVMDELFGESSFVAQFIWNNEGNVDQQSKIKGVHEYILCYVIDPEALQRPTVIDPNIEEDSKLYNDTIENSITKNGPANPPSEVLLPEGFPAAFDDGALKPRTDKWPHILDEIRVENREVIQPARVKSGWSSRNLLDLFIRNGCVPIVDSEGKETWFALTHTGALYGYKRRPPTQGHVLSVIRNVGTTKQNSGVLARWGIDFAYPKPVLLIRYLTEVFTGNDPDAVVLDFFAGSGTTGHAVLDLNAQDQGNRKFILVQLPEPTGRDDYPTIAEVTKERVRRVIDKLDKEDAGKLGEGKTHDRGFRVFKLDESNFKTWQADASADPEAFQAQLELHVDHLREGRSEQDILFELLLKSGFPLTTMVEEIQLAGRRVFSIAGGQFLICLDEDLTLELLRAMADAGPERVVCLDAAFKGNDQLKTNAVQIFKTKSVTSFRTV